MRKPSVKKLFRVVNTLEDGRKLYLSTHGKILVMPKDEADFWIDVARRVHGITIDEMVYSNDLQFYDRRSYFLERLEPFVRVVKTAPERADSPVDPEASSSAASLPPKLITSFGHDTIIATPS